MSLGPPVLTRSELTLFWRRLGSHSNGTLVSCFVGEGVRWCSMGPGFSFLVGAWWCPPTTPVLGRPERGDQEFKASLV